MNEQHKLQFDEEGKLNQIISHRSIINLDQNELCDDTGKYFKNQNGNDKIIKIIQLDHR